MYLQANNPEINAVKNAIINPWISMLLISETDPNSMMWIIAPPIIGANPIRNENSAAWLLLTPQHKAIEIVEPDRDIPGNIARACANPIRNAYLKEISYLAFLKKLLIIKIIPVIINIIETK